jgi:hypothetical protein
VTFDRGTWFAMALVGAFVLAGSTLAATPIEESARMPTRRAIRIDPPAPVIVIGDSAISALRWVPRAASAVVGFEYTLDLESCRRLFTPSCRGREGRVPPTVYQALEFHGDKYDTLVVATGYNDDAASFGASFEAVVGRARLLGYRRIVWWSLRSDVDYVSPGFAGNHEAFAANNRIIGDRLASGDFPDVVLADWGGYTLDKPEWFVTDGVHYRTVGAWAASDYLTRKMAFLDGRPCPVPTTPAGVPDDPCPDPDTTGPVADIEALYPIGAEGALCYEIGTERRFECRDETHVIQLTRQLAVGMTGDDVGALQTRLIRLDLLDGSATGWFDAATQRSVAGFQSSASLSPTGVADIGTLGALGFDTSAIVAGS